ncbi:hypothetical protein T492DRAFT_1143509 [Pavlovales sp. CCMP2436]|nr:hypothetical protein T492DRAFT_1143509 [Pavlovales sp. CCMP2436]
MIYLALVSLLALASSERAGRRPGGDGSVCVDCPLPVESIRLVRPRELSRLSQHAPFLRLHLGALKRVRDAPPEAVAPTVQAVACVLLHALFLLAQYWLPRLAWSLHYANEADAASATHAIVRPQAGRGSPALCRVQRAEGRLWVEWQHQRLAAAVPPPLPAAGAAPGGEEAEPLLACDLRFAEPDLPVGRPLRTYSSHAGLGALEHARLLEEHGPNECSVPPPDVRALLLRQLLAPMTIVQFATALLWCLDADPGRALMGILSALSFEATAALASYRSALAVHQLFRPPPPLLVLREGAWVRARAQTLVPADVFSLRAGAPVPCDALLMQGGALLDEASLTGEAVPQPKEALPPPRAAEAEWPLDDSPGGLHAASALRAGTRALQVDAPARAAAEGALPDCPPDGGVACYALRTGYRSAHGIALRAATREVDSTPASAAEARESLLLTTLLLLVGGGASAYVATHAAGSSSERELYVHCALILLSVLPADLPAQAALSVGAALRSLRKHGVLCVEPAALPAAATVRCVAFDKTGTLIHDTPALSAVVPLASLTANKPPATGAGRVHARAAPWTARLTLAGCHALVPPSSVAAAAAAEEGGAAAPATARPALSTSGAALGGALGDPIEKAALAALGCALSADGRTTWLPTAAWLPAHSADALLPRAKAAGTGTARGTGTGKRAGKGAGAEALPACAQLIVLHREPFTPARRRMSAVVRASADAAAARGLPAGALGEWVLVKGAPEAVALLADRVPPGFAAAHAAAAARGDRVLALAARRLSKREAAGVASGKLRASDVEQGAQIVGLALFRSAAHKDSSEAVELLHAAGIRTCVITGDALGTGVWAARECGVLGKRARVACLHILGCTV